MHQQPCARALLQAAVFQVARHLCELDELRGGFLPDAGLVDQDLSLQPG
jgi:hypothetical protein